MVIDTYTHAVQCHYKYNGHTFTCDIDLVGEKGTHKVKAQRQVFDDVAVAAV